MALLRDSLIGVERSAAFSVVTLTAPLLPTSEVITLSNNASMRWLTCRDGGGSGNNPRKPRLVTGGHCAASWSASRPRGAYPGATASRVRRAPRALEAVWKVLTDKIATGLSSGD